MTGATWGVCEFRELFCFRFAMMGALRAHNKWRELNFEDIWYARQNGFYAPEDIRFDGVREW